MNEDESSSLVSLHFFNNDRELVEDHLILTIMDSVDITVKPNVLTDYNVTWYSSLPAGIQEDSLHLWGQIMESWNDMYVMKRRLNVVYLLLSVLM